MTVCLSEVKNECSCFIEFIKRAGERDKMRGLSSILSLFPNELNKFNKIGAQMQDSILSYETNKDSILPYDTN